MKKVRSVNIQSWRNLKKDGDNAKHRAVQMRGALIDSTRNNQAIWKGVYPFRLPSLPIVIKELWDDQMQCYVSAERIL